MKRFVVAVLAAGLAVVGFVQAGGGTKLKIGDSAPKFSDLPGVDGKSHSLPEYQNKDVLVLCITCNHCPVAVSYEDRLINFAKKYTTAPDSKVALVAVNINNSDADKLDQMKIRAMEKGFNFPYLYDQSQKIAHQLNARVTPEFYVYGKDRKLVYWGAMDDSQNVARVKHQYLDQAVQAALQGQTPEVSLTKAFGCSLLYESK
jgi:peroxiredoxin